MAKPPLIDTVVGVFWTELNVDIIRLLAWLGVMLPGCTVVDETDEPPAASTSKTLVAAAPDQAVIIISEKLPDMVNVCPDPTVGLEQYAIPTLEAAPSLRSVNLV